MTLQLCTELHIEYLILIFLSALQSDIVFNRLVATSKVSLPALHFDCPLVCQANVCLRKDDSEDCLYSRSGSFTPRPHSECVFNLLILARWVYDPFVHYLYHICINFVLALFDCHSHIYWE